jgi:hypothetical protein
VETAGALRQDADMGDPVSEDRSSTLRVVNAIVWIVAGGVFAAIWLRDRALWSLLLAASCLLRAPVAFRYPTAWSAFRKPIGERDAPRGGFTPIDTLLSIASFLLLAAAGVAYAVSKFG